MKFILLMTYYFICSFANADSNQNLINKKQNVDVLYSNPNLGAHNNGIIILCINGIKYIETITYMNSSFYVVSIPANNRDTSNNPIPYPKSTTLSILENKDGKPQICTNKN